MNISRPIISGQDENYHKRASARLAAWLARSGPPLRSGSPTADQQRITVVCVSDTHNTRPPLPDGDILLHAGDLSQYGTFAEVQAQLNWLNEQSHRHKVVIAGNHDLILDTAFVKSHPDRELDRAGKSAGDLNWGSIFYLQDSSVTLSINKRPVTIFGSPWTPRCGNFAFQYDREEDIWAGKVSTAIDILLTHGPPATLLDNGKGCRHLLTEIWRSRVPLVVFGHIHEAHGHGFLELNSIQALQEKILLGQRGWSAVLQLLSLIAWKRLQSLYHKPKKTVTIKVVNAALDQRRITVSEFEAISVEL
ncbi:putative rhamnogalacturonate lyase C [Pseudocercospora fuligena]|uniref:Putative rhamnogalacturonate lyase C n=1 Tax=Pseudocercospora fuligena TaxID=685502 RepID=A0A8H6VNW8_9PEZI|nr:putative rhamnogalacturonate lyase C [Pseudocercospora fuligena]